MCIRWLSPNQVSSSPFSFLKISKISQPIWPWREHVEDGVRTGLWDWCRWIWSPAASKGACFLLFLGRVLIGSWPCVAVQHMLVRARLGALTDHWFLCRCRGCWSYVNGGDGSVNVGGGVIFCLEFCWLGSGKPVWIIKQKKVWSNLHLLFWYLLMVII